MMGVQKQGKSRMAVKKRKDSVYFIYEGYREGYFLEYLAGFSKVRYNSDHCNGGSANQIVINGIKHSFRDVNVFLFFDEDFWSKPGYTISDETIEGLERAWKINNVLKGCSYRDLQAANVASRNPILIVSNPHSIEGLLLRILGTSMQNLESKTTKQLKNMIDGHMGNTLLKNEDNEKIRAYDKKIAKYVDETAKLLPSGFKNKNHCKYLKEKIR